MSAAPVRCCCRRFRRKRVFRTIEMLLIAEIKAISTGKYVAMIYLLLSVSYSTRLILGQLVGVDVVSTLLLGYA